MKRFRLVAFVAFSTLPLAGCYIGPYPPGGGGGHREYYQDNQDYGRGAAPYNEHYYGDHYYH